MAKIQIYETDLTKRSRTYNITSNAVYIPGFTSKDLDTDYNKITLCETVKDLEDTFGEVPYQFKKENKITKTTYSKTTDTDIDSQKTYYTYNNDTASYDKVTNPSKENISTYFEQIVTTIDTYTADSYDLSYVYAKELLNLGLPVYYEAFNPTDSVTTDDSKAVENMYKALLNKELIKLKDRNEYNLKFITLGAYESFDVPYIADKNPDYEFSEKQLPEILLTLSTERGDVLSLIDYSTSIHTNAEKLYNSIVNNVTISENKTITTGPEEHVEYINNYGAVFVGWASYNLKSDYSKQISVASLPGSFAYLKCLALSTQIYPNYYAIAGVTRGLVKDIQQPAIYVTGAEAEEMQPDDSISINPITKINPYGYCIWGNRTLHKNDDLGLVATSFLNIRLLACDVKKIVRSAATQLNFEINSDVLWLNFKSIVEPELDKIIANNGIEKYKLTRLETTDKGAVKAKVTIWCLYAVEKWDIEIELTDSYVSVE